MTLRLLVSVIVAVMLAASCSGVDSAQDASAVDENPVPTEVIASSTSTATEVVEDANAAEDTPGDLTTASASEDGEPETNEAAGSDEDSDDQDDPLGALISLLPATTQQVFAADVKALLTGDSAQDTAALLGADSSNPTLAEPLAVIGTLTQSIDRGELGNALVAYTSPAGSPALIATINGLKLEDVVAGPMPAFDRTYGSSAYELYLDEARNQLALLPGGVLVVGSASSVESIIDVAEAPTVPEAGAITPFLDELDGASDIGFAYALPAMFDDSMTTGSTLGAATAVVGAIDVVEGAITGTLAFHMANGAEFVDAFNSLNRASTEGGTEAPLAVAEPVVDGLDQIVVEFPALALNPGSSDAETSLSFFKKLLVGMDALDYANGVADRSNPAWLDFVVKSEADPSAPTSPGSVYIRWRFKSQEAIEAFEQNELPAGFRLAPTRFIETDDPDGEIFFALNLYNAAGGSIVGGARAEWDVFVHGPEGADPNAGERPRFMVVDVLAEEVSADSADLLTPAEPLSHALVNGTVVSAGARYDDDGVAVPVFESSFPVPDPTDAQVARFTREMAIGNDYIYWAHGVSDRVFYNATTFNHDAYLVDVDQLEFSGDARWSQYLEADVMDAVYYVNNLEYVASPMANLDSEFLDITPEWLATLVGFTTNGHQDGLMRAAVEQLFMGEGDPFVGMRLDNATPATFYHFEITNAAGLEASLDLPAGRQLAPIALFDGAEAANYLTLSVFEPDTAVAGIRAQWSVYTDDGSGRPPHMLVIESMTNQVDFNPATILDLPALVQHSVEGTALATTLASPTIAFEASFDTSAVDQQALSLDWIEAGDRVCSRNGVCDLFYYDAETLDVAVDVASDVTFTAVETPWTPFVEATPSIVFYRDNAQEYAVKRWYDLDVAVEPLPFSGLQDPSHTISGSGSLIGRDNDLVNSDYSYTGDAILEGDLLRFAIVQEIQNALGTAMIFTVGSFDLVTASGTQTVIDCTGDALICSDIENGSTDLYVAQNLDPGNRDAIAWEIDAPVDLGAFGTADSTSSFDAIQIDS